MGVALPESRGDSGFLAKRGPPRKRPIQRQGPSEHFEFLRWRASDDIAVAHAWTTRPAKRAAQGVDLAVDPGNPGVARHIRRQKPRIFRHPHDQTFESVDIHGIDERAEA